jgi:hypothetical protein
MNWQAVCRKFCPLKVSDLRLKKNETVPVELKLQVSSFGLRTVSAKFLQFGIVLPPGGLVLTKTPITSAPSQQ